MKGLNYILSGIVLRFHGIRLMLPVRILLLAILSLLLSCNEEPIDWELDTHRPDLLVVEAVLTNERKAHEVKISRPVADPSDVPEPVEGAAIAIFDGTNATLLSESSPGIYHTVPSFRAVYNKLYYLVIYNDGREYSAASFLVPVRRLDPLQYKRVQGQQNWYELVLHETQDASMVEIWLDWSHLPAFRGQPAEATQARIVYYTVKSIDVNQWFKPGKERVFFPAGTRVVRRKYSMNQYQEDFVRTMMAETEWRGGLFDVQPGNVRTNLTQGAVGYFSVSTVVADSSVITPL
ncbi:DUF4249 family protein [Bacteroidota bacterium]